MQYLAIYERDMYSLRLELVGAFNVGELDSNDLATMLFMLTSFYLHSPQTPFEEYLLSAFFHTL